MIIINLITIGKLKEQYLRDGCDEFIKRLNPFCKFSVIEIPETRINNNYSEKNITAALENEGKLIKSYMDKNNTYNIALCIEGDIISSSDFSKILENAGIMGNSTINFIIGSSFGIAPCIKKSADFRLSMSKMTFPHQLARLMLLEQIYRGFQISLNGKYHK